MSSPSSAEPAGQGTAGRAGRPPRLDRLDRAPGGRRPRRPSRRLPGRRAGGRLERRRSWPSRPRACGRPPSPSPTRPRWPGSTCRPARNASAGRTRSSTLATRDDVDLVVVGTGGVVSLRPVLAALRAGKVVATANKETLVAGGHLVMPLARALAADVAAIPPGRPVRQPARLAPPDRLRALGDLAVPRRRAHGRRSRR